MKHLLLSITLILCISVSVFAQGETVFYQLKNNSRDGSGNHNYGRLEGNAYVDNALFIGYNTNDELKVPVAVINGLMHYDISFDVFFDSLHAFGALARNSVIDGGYQCGDGRVDIYYNKVAPHAKSWILMLEGAQYIFHDPELLAQEWDHIEVVKRRDSVEMFRNDRLLGAYPDVSDPIDILALEIGQAAACVGDILPMCMDGKLKNFKIISYDKTDSTDAAVQQNLAKTVPVTLNIYPNPSTGVVAVFPGKIAIIPNQQVLIKVYNDFGQLVKEISSPLNKNPIQLDLSNAAAGIYFISLQAGNASATGKVVIK